MSTTQSLTIPTDEKLQEALQERAAKEGKTVPELAREILSEAVTERPLVERVGHLRGKLRLQGEASDPWRAHLRESNFRS
jgi:plasmid stability protein